MNDWQVRSNNRSNPALIMKYAKNCGSTFDWIFNNLNEKDFETFNIMHYKPRRSIEKRRVPVWSRGWAPQRPAATF